MKSITVPKDGLFLTGLILILVSFCIYCMPFMSVSIDKGGLFMWVVNITSGDKQHLVREIEAVITSNRLKPLL